VHTATGAVLVERRVGSAGDAPASGTTRVDPRTGRLWIVMGGTMQVIDPLTLDSLARFPSEGPQTAIAFDPLQPMAVAVASRQQGFTAHYTSTARMIDTDSFAVTLTTPLPGIGTSVAGAVFAPRSPRPSSLTATVTHRNVTLQWTLGTGAPASAMFVDAGSAPGLSNLASIALPPGATSYLAAGIPTGTYYVRVRTQTAGGVATISNEVNVIVR
jgi:hypothetical protein